MNEPPQEESKERYNLQPFRRAVLRGFGVVLPPLLTIVILLWIANSVQTFVLTPVEWFSRQAIVWFMNDTDSEEIQAAFDVQQKKDQIADAAAVDAQQKKDQIANAPGPQLQSDKDSQLSRIAGSLQRLERRFGTNTSQQQSENLDPGGVRFKFEDTSPESMVYVRLANGEWLPAHILDQVREHVMASGVEMPNRNVKGYYNYYVENKILRKSVVIPVFFAGFILLMYLLGKFLAAGVGRILWNSMESIITQLPIIRTVYNSVKQVTDFFVGESDMGEFQRVVAVEYPRKGIWSVGFVTGESLLTIRGVAEEAVVSILMPTSPVPGTGFTISVRKSETVDLDIPIDQALQFVVSCGVVVPEGQIGDEEVRARIEAAAREGGFASAIE